MSCKIKKNSIENRRIYGQKFAAYFFLGGGHPVGRNKIGAVYSWVILLVAGLVTRLLSYM